MLNQKKGMELTTSTIIILVLVVLVLVILIMILTGAFGDFGKQIIGKIKWAFGIWPNATGP